MNIFHRANLQTTLICMGLALGALFLAQIPNDTRSEWFRSLVRPEILPRAVEKKIGFIWTSIFLLAGLGTAAALATANSDAWKRTQIRLILGALALNMSYTFTFTHLRNLWLSTAIAAALAILLAVLVATTLYRKAWLSALCHSPHLSWVCFATYVTLRMAQLNG
jgi:tryptophan-rich sensory protein